MKRKNQTSILEGNKMINKTLMALALAVGTVGFAGDAFAKGEKLDVCPPPAAGVENVKPQDAPASASKGKTADFRKGKKAD